MTNHQTWQDDSMSLSTDEASEIGHGLVQIVQETNVLPPIKDLKGEVVLTSNQAVTGGMSTATAMPSLTSRVAYRRLFGYLPGYLARKKGCSEGTKAYTGYPCSRKGEHTDVSQVHRRLKSTPSPLSKK
jgi:hypothetical protein